jgi:hypothetical protein
VFWAARVREACSPRDAHRTFHQRRQIRQAVIGGRSLGRHARQASRRRGIRQAREGVARLTCIGPVPQVAWFSVCDRSGACLEACSVLSLSRIGAGACERAAGSWSAQRPRSGAAGVLDAAGRERIMGQPGRRGPPGGGSVIRGSGAGPSCGERGGRRWGGRDDGEGAARLT